MIKIISARILRISKQEAPLAVIQDLGGITPNIDRTTSFEPRVRFNHLI